MMLTKLMQTLATSMAPAATRSAAISASTHRSSEDCMGNLRELIAGRSAARSGALQTRDRWKLRVRDDPGSAGGPQPATPAPRIKKKNFTAPPPRLLTQ